MGIIASETWTLTATGERIDWTDIKPRVDMARVATSLLGPAAKRQGRYLLWPCPFHDDHDPSFQVDTLRGTWKCWPCDLGGDAPALVMKRNGVTFPEAVRFLAELEGIVPTTGRPASPRPRSPTARLERPASPPPKRSFGLPLADALALVTEAADRLWEPEGTEALSYLRRRGLSEQTIRAARLGVVKSVSIPTREGDRYYQARGVVIPWVDGDRLALVKIRQPERAKPKYVEAFRDRPAIYPCTDAIEPGRPLVNVEGELDALLLGQELRDLAAVVTLGSASGKPDPGILANLLPAAPWFLALDGDTAGDKAADGWPARAVRVRPPEPFKDWTEAAQAGVNLRCWWLPRLGGTEALWSELAGWHWGPALNDPAPGVIGDSSDSVPSMNPEPAPVSKQRRPRKPPPPSDDPRYLRTCTRCHHIRQWVLGVCPRCGNPEFSLPGPIETKEEPGS
jgi:hypothetical protein